MKSIIIIILAIILTSGVDSQWVLQTSGTNLSLSDIWMFSADNVIVCGDEGLIIRTTNGGANWNSVPSGTTEYLGYIFFLNASTGWIAGDDSLHKTIDGGNTWTTISATTGRAPFFINANTGWMGAGNSSIKKTINGGVSWTTTPVPVSSITENVIFVNENTGFATGTRPVPDSTYIYKSTNAGLTWVVLRGEHELFQGFNVLDASNILVCGYHGFFQKTTNGGSSWLGTGTPTLLTMQDLSFTNSLSGYICGDAGSVYATLDGGASWQNQLQNTTENFNAIKFLAPDNNTGYVIGSAGLIYKTVNGGVIGINQIGTEMPGGFSLSQNYPNPFNPVTNIKFDIPKAGNVKLVVFDITGRQAAELVNENLNAGTYNYNFNATHLSSGVYFYKLLTDDFTQVKKMVLIR